MNNPERAHTLRESSAEAAPQATEDVLGEFEDSIETSLPSSEEERARVFNVLHGALDKFENHAVKTMYDEGRMPTFGSLEIAVRLATHALENIDDADTLRIAKLLTGSVTSVKRWCRKYVTSILRFRNMKTALLRMNSEDQRDAYAQSDHDRRRIHDALLGSLATLLDLLREAEEFAEFKEPIFWKPAAELPPGTANEQPVVFGAEALSDRDLIRDWAIVADRIEEIRKITGHVEPRATA